MYFLNNGCFVRGGTGLEDSQAPPLENMNMKKQIFESVGFLVSHIKSEGKNIMTIFMFNGYLS